MHHSVYLTEFADNGSLDKHIQQHKEQPNFEQSLKWAKQVAQGTYTDTYVGIYVPHNLEIALCILRILRLRTIAAQYHCAISRLRNHSVQSFTPTCMCRNHLVVAREATKKWQLCVCLVK